MLFFKLVCAPLHGSLNGILAGSHYNRAWTVHSAFTEALERPLFERFLAESGDEIPILLHHASQDPFQNNNEILQYKKMTLSQDTLLGSNF